MPGLCVSMGTREVRARKRLTTTWHEAKPWVQVHAPRLQTGLPSPPVLLVPWIACRALVHAPLVVQTPQVGPSKPAEHCWLQPALAFPARTAEKGWRAALWSKGLSHPGWTQLVPGENPGGQAQVPLLRAEP